MVPFSGRRSGRIGKAARSRRLGLAGVGLLRTWTARRYFVHGEVLVWMHRLSARVHIAWY
jgi:hypothetical protein